MGADIVGWYGCPLQEALGQGKFLLKLKLRSYRRAAEALLRSEGRNLRSVKVRVHLLGQGMREMTLDDIIAALGDFEKGIVECRTCPVSGGAVLGCYEYLTYPIDESAESALFRFIIEGADDPASAARWMVDEILLMLAEEPREPLRGASPGKVAVRLAPFIATVPSREGPLQINSSLVLRAVRLTVEDPTELHGYDRFSTAFVHWLDARNEPDSRSLQELRRLQTLIARLAALEGAVHPRLLVDA